MIAKVKQNQMMADVKAMHNSNCELKLEKLKSVKLQVEINGINEKLLNEKSQNEQNELNYCNEAKKVK